MGEVLSEGAGYPNQYVQGESRAVNLVRQGGMWYSASLCQPTPGPPAEFGFDSRAYLKVKAPVQHRLPLGRPDYR